jgi:hypothetical protein
MASWPRLHRLNRLTGTLLPRLALDFVPGMLCSAYVALLAENPATSLEDRIVAGRAAQRLWLTATTLGLQMQPQYTPLVFARYAAERRSFTSDQRAQADACEVERRVRRELGRDAVERAIWLARIGPRRSAPGRSLRLPLSKLIVADPPAQLPPLDPA